MPAFRSIEHITLTTGGVRMSPRSEVEEDTIRRIVAAMRAGGKTKPDGLLPANTDNVQVRAGGKLWAGWSVRVQPLGPGAWRYDLAQQDTTVVACWLCAEKATSDEIWEQAIEHSTLDEHAVVARPRGVPWLAVTLLPSALLMSAEQIGMAGDAERCIAWAILERA